MDLGIKNAVLNESQNSNWFVIVNPHAGSKKTQDDWPIIRSLLIEAGFLFDTVFTEYQYHATELAKNAIAISGFKKIIVIGGDGTLNEIINGVFAQDEVKPTDVSIGIISVGTGNDWGRMYNMPSDYKKQIDVIKQNKTYIQDVGCVSYQHHDKEKVHYL